MREQEVRDRLRMVIAELLLTEEGIGESASQRLAASLVDALWEEVGTTGIWLTGLEPNSRYELALRRYGESAVVGVLTFGTDMSGLVVTGDLGPLSF